MLSDEDLTGLTAALPLQAALLVQTVDLAYPQSLFGIGVVGATC
jgi:hypothetical protein